MIGFVVCLNGKEIGQLGTGSIGMVSVYVSGIQSTGWLRKERQDLTLDWFVMQLDTELGRRTCTRAPVQLRLGDVVTIRAIETTELSRGKWSKWEPHDFIEDRKNHVRSQCFAMGWEIDEGA